MIVLKQHLVFSDVVQIQNKMFRRKMHPLGFHTNCEQHKHENLSLLFENGHCFLLAYMMESKLSQTPVKREYAAVVEIYFRFSHFSKIRVC